ncbi:hypothetical protein D3C75_468210 [compost metagenome]
MMTFFDVQDVVCCHRIKGQLHIGMIVNGHNSALTLSKVVTGAVFAIYRHNNRWFIGVLVLRLSFEIGGVNVHRIDQLPGHSIHFHKSALHNAIEHDRNFVADRCIAIYRAGDPGMFCAEIFRRKDVITGHDIHFDTRMGLGINGNILSRVGYEGISMLIMPSHFDGDRFAIHQIADLHINFVRQVVSNFNILIFMAIGGQRYVIAWLHVTRYLTGDLRGSRCTFIRIDNVIARDSINSDTSANVRINGNRFTVCCRKGIPLIVLPGHAHGDGRGMAQIVNADVFAKTHHTFGIGKDLGGNRIAIHHDGDVTAVMNTITFNDAADGGRSRTRFSNVDHIIASNIIEVNFGGGISVYAQFLRCRKHLVAVVRRDECCHSRTIHQACCINRNFISILTRQIWQFNDFTGIGISTDM